MFRCGLGRLYLFLVTLILVSGSFGVGLAQDRDIGKEIEQYGQAVKALQFLVDKEIIDKSTQEEGLKSLEVMATSDFGELVPVKKLFEQVKSSQKSKSLSPWQAFKGFWSLKYFLLIIGITLVVVFGWAWWGEFFLNLLKVFTFIPVIIYEGIFYIVSGMLIFEGFYNTDIGTYLIFAGCLAILGSLFFTIACRKLDPSPTVISVWMTIIWGGIAIASGSQLVGMLACIALMCSLGYSEPLGHLLGCEKDAVAPKLTIISFAILAFYCVLMVWQIHAPFVNVFEKGVFIVITFVAYTGLLYMTTKWYSRGGGTYLLMQIVAIAIGLAGMFIGNMWDVGMLQKKSTSFLLVGFFLKIVEIPTEDWQSTSFKLMVIGIGLLGLYFWMGQYPELAMKYLLFNG